MTDDLQPIDSPTAEPIVVTPAERASERRQFFRTALGAAAVTVAGATALTLGPRAFADTTSDVDNLNFALQLGYLEAQFYNIAAFGGTGLPAGQLTAGSAATGTNVAGQATGARQVTFTDPLVAQYAAEIAQDKAAHVAWLRTELNTVASAQPAIDLGIAATGAFSTAMRAAGVITGAGSTFDPYASDGNFLLAAFLFADVGVSVLRGAIALITDAGHREVVEGAMITDAHHAAIIRTTLYAKGATTASLRTNADLISNLRDALDGTGDDDQGISPSGTGATAVANVIPAYADGTIFARDTTHTLNIAYLNSAQVTKGGFFPNGVNGTVVTSAAN
ncbi:MAG: ferritin-like protein [Sphingomonas bacterium]|uniref:ferritin-like domain-containing protein n=1 Tax=Sphingomonas bacterium TaxID=1895847 RepID=UPI002637A5FE|nr:ferritin-like domain-containing protein [Sphingomonas bacterium]MDB5710448.1 ferritin-like protein [Sphingomonas bacterium]